MESKSLNRQRHIEVAAADLPLHCPLPSMLLWNSHPRVFLPIEKTGEALCPYGGTLYPLKGGARAGQHCPPSRFICALRASARRDRLHKILVIGPSWVGDTILAQPLLRRLREQHPDAQLDVL